jgi:hypothetical protein
MPFFKLFKPDSGGNLIPDGINPSSEISQAINDKPIVNEAKEPSSPGSQFSDESTSLLEDGDFIEIRKKYAASVEASVSEFGEKALEIIRADLNHHKTLKLKYGEERIYQVLKELQGLEDTRVSGVDHADAVCEVIFNKIAAEYATDKAMVQRIQDMPGYCIFPNKATVLPTLFSNFPNILNDQELNEEDKPRLSSPSPWGF